MPRLKERISKLLASLQEGLYERDHVMALSLLAMISGESIFLLGPSGVAKSMIARRLKLAFKEGRSFEYLVSRFSTTDELFGPVSISKLKDEDCYERNTKGYLPDSEIVFLDEIWKSSQSVLNTLLTVLNEHIFRNGTQDKKIPLQLLIAASNELPGEGLSALWDRFLLRYVVTGITRDENFDAMISDTRDVVPAVEPQLLFKQEELDMWRESVNHVRLPEQLFLFIHAMRRLLLHPNGENNDDEVSLYVSDRRWKKSVRIMRASAFVMESDEVHLADALLLTCILWDKPMQIADIQRLMLNALTQAMKDFLQMDLLRERMVAIRMEAKKRLGHEEKPQNAPKLVHAFYYQLKTHTSKTVLVYASEFEKLTPGKEEEFILLDDKLKTGAQILKRYERTKHPGVFPRDILKVNRAGLVLNVNKTSYPLLLSDEAAEVKQSGMATQISAELRQQVARLQTQITEAVSSFRLFKEKEEAYLNSHLFLDDNQKGILRSAFNNVNYALKSLALEIEELCQE